MNKDELKQILINANSDRTLPRSDEEINTIIENFEKKNNIREANVFKSYRKKIFEIITELNLDKNDYRLFAVPELGMGIFVRVLRDTNKAQVSFSFLNSKDVDAEAELDPRSFKYYSLLNYKLNHYTYDVEWKGRSEFAIYDAFVSNHHNFPSFFKKISMRVNIGIFGTDYNYPVEQ